MHADRPRTARPARILYLITDLQTGGVPLHLHRLATQLDPSEFEPLVLSLAPPGPVTDLLERDRVPTASCLARGPLDLRALLRLRRIIKRFDPHLVHSLLFHANIAMRLVGPLAGIPSRLIINEIQTVEIQRRWHLAVDHLTHTLCRLQVGNSIAVVNHLCQQAGIPHEHLLHIPGGIDATLYDRPRPVQRSQLHVPDRAPLILWVGRMDPVKRLNDLLHALHGIRLDPPPHLVLVGDGPERHAIDTLASQLRLRQRVHQIGFRSDVPALLATADAFALPSLTEGMPNALLEAMASRLPVVACDIPACREVIRHGIDGLLVAPASPQQLSGALRTALNDKACAQRLGQAARARVLSLFSQQASHQRYLQLYRAVLAKPNNTLTSNPLPNVP